MRSIAGLFGRSPFKLLEKHMEQVREAASEIPALFEALYAGDHDKVKEVSERIMKLEHKADELKNEIRREMPNNFFMPVDRKDFLSLLSAQDDIADAAEDLSIVLRFKALDFPEQLKAPFADLVEKVMTITGMVNSIVQELDNLMEVSFAGPEAEMVNGMINDLSTMEWEADKLQFKTAKLIFAIEDDLKKGEFFVFLEIVKKLGSIADKSEKVAKILRMFITG